MTSNLTAWIPAFIILLAAIASALKDILLGELKDRQQKVVSVVLFSLLFLGALCSFLLTNRSSQQSQNIEGLNRQILAQNDDLRRQLDETKRDLSLKGTELSKRTDQLVAKSAKIEELNAFILSSMTGGDSFCYLELTAFGPSAAVPIVAAEGEHPLYDVSVRIADLRKFEQERESSEKWSYEKLMFMYRVLQVGNLRPPMARTFDPVPIPPGTDTIRYNVFITARNGSFTEFLRLKRVGTEWKRAMRVEKDCLPREKCQKRILLKEHVDKDYPLGKNGKVEWE